MSAGTGLVACVGAVEAEEVPVSLLRVLLDMDEATMQGELAPWLASGAVVEARPGWVSVPERPDEARAARELRRRFVEVAVDAAAAAAVRVGADDGLAGPTSPSWPGPFGSRSAAAFWVVEHREILVAGVRVGVADRLVRRASELARSLWGLTGQIPVLGGDAGWRRQLSVCGERAAREWGNIAALAALLERSARVAFAVDDVATAERQWLGALRAWRQVRDEPRVGQVLLSLIDLYQRAGRLHRALDAAFELLDEQRRRAVAVEVAEALVRIGDLMVLAGRGQDAVHYLRRAADAFAELDPPAPTRHARALVRLGRALWARGADRAARRCFHRALGLLVDVDGERAEQVRSLLRAPQGGTLPD